MDTFATDVTGLRNATRPEVIVLDHGAELTLRPGPVAKRLGDATVRMLGYNGSIPGPTAEGPAGLRDRRHCHQRRRPRHHRALARAAPGQPVTTASRTRPRRRSRSAALHYRIQFPDPGLYWYHPHIREDYAQELGLYGNILVEPAEAGLLAAGRTAT